MATATQTIPLDHNVQSYVSKPRQMFINGKWVNSASGKTFPTYNPATGEVLAQIAEGDREDIDRAVNAARAAFDKGPWRTMTPSERGRMIWKLADLIEKHREEFAQLESLDNGKPVTVARVADVPHAADLFRYMAGWATKIEGNTIPDFRARRAWQFFGLYAARARRRRRPDHPVEFPADDGCVETGPGACRGMLRRAEARRADAATALRLGELIQEAGFPDGVVNIVPGYGETAGAALAAHPNVDKIAFTGSTEVGKLIVQAAAGNLKKVRSSWAANRPTSSFGDAEIDNAIPGAAMAIFFNHGQCCCAGSRLYVEQKEFDKVVDGISQIASKIKVGPGMEPSTEMGPLVSEEQMNRVCGYLESGFSEGAKAMAGGSRQGTRATSSSRPCSSTRMKI